MDYQSMLVMNIMVDIHRLNGVSRTNNFSYTFTNNKYIGHAGNDESVELFYRRTSWHDATDEMLNDISLKLIALNNYIKKTFKNRNISIVNNTNK